MTNEEFIERVKYFVSDDFLQMMEQHYIDMGIERPYIAARAISAIHIHYLVKLISEE